MRDDISSSDGSDGEEKGAALVGQAKAAAAAAKVQGCLAHNKLPPPRTLP